MKKRNAKPVVMQEESRSYWKGRLFVAFSFVAGLSVATQVFAWQYRYDEFLGVNFMASIPRGAYLLGKHGL